MRKCARASVPVAKKVSFGEAIRTINTSRRRILDNRHENRIIPFLRYTRTVKRLVVILHSYVVFL